MTVATMARRTLALGSVAAVLAGAGAVGASHAPPQTPGSQAGGSAPGRGGVRPQPDPIDFTDHAGWTALFNGRTLDGWDGNPDVWKVENGTLVGAFDGPAGQRNGQTFIVWKGGEVANFELTLEIKLEGDTADSGIQYRGANDPG